LNISEIVLGVVLVVLIVLQQQGLDSDHYLEMSVGGKVIEQNVERKKLFFNLTVIFIILVLVNGLAIAIIEC